MSKKSKINRNPDDPLPPSFDKWSDENAVDRYNQKERINTTIKDLREISERLADLEDYEEYYYPKLKEMENQLNSSNYVIYFDQLDLQVSYKYIIHEDCPFVVYYGSAEEAMNFAESLEEKGIWTSWIIPQLCVDPVQWKSIS